jgi:ATP-dependent Clp protease ATP-binding subunit ClpC
MTRRHDSFTDRARRLLNLAFTRAKCSNTDELGTDHIFVAILLFDEPSVARYVLEELGFDFEAAREIIGIETGDRVKLNFLQPWPRVEDSAVLQQSRAEATALGHNYIGIEHLLLAVSRDEDSQAATLLRKSGLTADAIRNKVLEVL